MSRQEPDELIAALQEDVDPKPPRRFRDVLAVPVPRFAKVLLAHKRTKKSGWRHAVVYGDSHFPFQDESALSVVRGVVKDVQPDLVVHDGDLLDCYKISNYDQNPMRADSLQDEIDAGRTHLHQISQIAPDAEKLLLGGNHEDRLRKVVWKLQGAQRQLAKLRVFQQIMTWPVLLDLVNIGWDYVDYRRQPVVGRIPKVLLKHGNIVRKWSGWSAKGEWEKHAKSGISGHTHRLGVFYHRDLNGSHLWHESGCTCQLEPEYVQQPDWQQGCLVVAYTDERFQMEPVYIQDGKALWRSKELVA